MHAADNPPLSLPASLIANDLHRSFLSPTLCLILTIPVLFAPDIDLSRQDTMLLLLYYH